MALPRWPATCPTGPGVPGAGAGLGPFPATGVLTRRLVEVELHHADLGSGYTPADWPASFTGLDLPEPMRGQRDSRLARGAPA